MKSWKPQNMIQAAESSSTNEHMVSEDLLRALKVAFFTVLCFKWSVKKHCVAKISQGIWERFLYENNRNYNSYKSSYKFAFIPCLSFRRNQK